MSKPTRLDYCQYLLSTPINYTLTHFADHCEAFSHDKINRYLAGDQLRPDTFGKPSSHPWSKPRRDISSLTIPL